jgi:hypothetical protein
MVISNLLILNGYHPINLHSVRRVSSSRYFHRSNQCAVADKHAVSKTKDITLAFKKLGDATICCSKLMKAGGELLCLSFVAAHGTTVE